MRRTAWAIALLASTAVVGCTGLKDALTAHSRPVAEVGPYKLQTEDLARLMAGSPMPDSALTAHWAEQTARLWADWMTMVSVYEAADSTLSLDYDPLLEQGRYLAVLAVQRYRDSVVLANAEPTDEQVREWFETRHPFTRLEVRRIVLALPAEADTAGRAARLAEAEALRGRLAGGADFVATARAASDEPAGARGQVLSFQGHEDFPPAADSVVFDLRPGEISPVILAGDTLYLYQVEGRREPALDDVRDIAKERLGRQRREELDRGAADSLLAAGHRTLGDGAVDVARRVASDPAMAVGRVAGQIRLVRFEGGAFTVDELRNLFLARPDLRKQFAEGDDDEIRDWLMQLAGDDILIDAATRAGTQPTAAQRQALAEALAFQLAQIGTWFNLSHALVTAPQFDTRAEGLAFLRRILTESKPVPWLTEFRLVLNRTIPTRVNESAAAAAARRAVELREGARSEVPARTGEDSGAAAGHDGEDGGS